jgi:hypothetical protein
MKVVTSDFLVKETGRCPTFCEESVFLSCHLTYGDVANSLQDCSRELDRAPRQFHLDLRRFQEHIEQCRTRFEAETKLIKDIETQYFLIHADETDEIENRLYAEHSGGPRLFHGIFGFSRDDIDAIYDLLEEYLNVRRRGRHRSIGPQDSLPLLFHWLLSRTSTDAIAKSLGVAAPTTDDQSVYLSRSKSSSTENTISTVGNHTWRPIDLLSPETQSLGYKYKI